MCDGKSRLEYCLDKTERSPSPLPDPPRAGTYVGRAAVVIFLSKHFPFELYLQRKRLELRMLGISTCSIRLTIISNSKLLCCYL